MGTVCPRLCLHMVSEGYESGSSLTLPHHPPEVAFFLNNLLRFKSSPRTHCPGTDKGGVDTTDRLRRS